AIVGTIGLLVKVALDADGKMKELNRTLLESGVAGAELADQYGMAGENLGKLRDTFVKGKSAFNFNVLWGTTAKDHLQILGAYAEAGQSFRDLTQGAKN